MKGEIQTVYYSQTIKGVTSYSYVIPIGSPGSGGGDPYQALKNDPLPKGAVIVGDGHTHEADANDTDYDDNGKLVYDGTNNFNSNDLDFADKQCLSNPNYIGSSLGTPNGKDLIYTPNGNTGSDRNKDVKKVSDMIPSDPNSETRQHKDNPVSPNFVPEVLPYGTTPSDVQKLPKLPENKN